MNNDQKKISVLIVEDESIVAMELEGLIADYGYIILGTHDNYDDALEILLSQEVDILICDIYLDGEKTGIDLVHTIKTHKLKTQIIYLTAYGDTDTILKAIDTEPCGYLIKPFKQEELFALLELASKKHTLVQLNSSYSYNLQTDQLLYNNQEFHLTKKERKLLKALINLNGKILSFEDMEYILWPNNSVGDSTRRTLVYRLNKKLKYKLIQTIAGEGYTLTAFYVEV